MSISKVERNRPTLRLARRGEHREPYPVGAAPDRERKGRELDPDKQPDTTKDPKGFAARLREHAAFLHEESGPVDALIRAGETTVSVDLQNYLSLHRFAEELAKGWAEQVELTNALQERNQQLQIAHLLQNYKRGPGRPRKVTLGMLARQAGLLGTAARSPKKRGRPPKSTEEDKTFIVAYVLRTKDRIAERTGRPVGRVTDKEAIEELEREHPPEEPMALYRSRARVAKICKLVSKYRKELGVQIRPRKSRNSIKNPP